MMHLNAKLSIGPKKCLVFIWQKKLRSKVSIASEKGWLGRSDKPIIHQIPHLRENISWGGAAPVTLKTTGLNDKEDTLSF